MEITVSETFGQHKYKESLSWMFRMAIKGRSVTHFSLTRMTKRQKRKELRGFREYISSGRLPHEHPYMSCLNCSKCKL